MSTGTTMTTNSSNSSSHKKVWFITGTSSGLGREIAKHALARGDNVIASARRLEAIKDLKTSEPLLDGADEECNKGLCKTIQLDVTASFDTIRKAAAEAMTFFGRVDVLVLNAGAGMLGISEEVGVEGYQKQFATNFFGPLNVTHAFLPYMRAARSGTIVFVGSRSSWRPGVLMLGTYASSKAALSAAAEALAVEVAPFGIRVLDICPGGLRTTNWDKMILLPVSREASLDRGSAIATVSDVQVLTDPSEIAVAPNASTSASQGSSSNTTGGPRDDTQTGIADYAPYRDAHVQFMSTLSGTQPGDPVRTAQAIVDAVRVEGAFAECVDTLSTTSGKAVAANPWGAGDATSKIINGDEEKHTKPLPSLVVLGSDAIRDVRNKCKSVLRNLDEWGHVGRSIDISNPPANS